MSEIWEPRKTVLYMADARVGYDNFKKKTIISIGNIYIFKFNIYRAIFKIQLYVILKIYNHKFSIHNNKLNFFN